MIPENITREHVLKAIEELDAAGDVKGEPIDYHLKYKNKTYPPKVIISKAYKYLGNGTSNQELPSSQFSGDQEIKAFLIARGFEIIDTSGQTIDYDTKIDEEEEYGRARDFSSELKDFLEQKYSIPVKDIRKNRLLLPSGAVIQVRGSSKGENEEGFYHLVKANFDFIQKNHVGYFAIVFDEARNTFLLSKEKVAEIFKEKLLTIPKDRPPRWYFNIIENNTQYFLKIHHSDAKEYNISSFLNKWEQVIKFTDSKESLNDDPDKSKIIQEPPHIFVTGYPQRNLEISKHRGIVGWVNKSKFLSNGFNKDTLTLDTVFKVKFQSSNDTLIWADEVAAGKIFYSNRWDAELLYDNLNIPLEKINSIPPFDKEKFQGLLRGNFPMPLDTPSNKDKYARFREVLLEELTL